MRRLLAAGARLLVVAVVAFPLSFLGLGSNLVLGSSPGVPIASASSLDPEQSEAYPLASQPAESQAEASPQASAGGVNPSLNPWQFLSVESPSLLDVQDLALRYGSAGPAPRLLLARHEVPYVSGQPLTLQWNVEVADFVYHVSPAAFTRYWVDQRDPTLAHVEFLDYEQGQTYDLVVMNAEAEDGSRSDQICQLRVSTAPALEVTGTWPEHGTLGIGLTARPTITFSKPVADRAAAERAITVDPPTPVVYVWTDDTQVELSPAGGWPFETEVTISVVAGQGSVVAQDGSYLPDPVRFQFFTRPNKTIDVDLTKQVLTCWDGEELVCTFPTATGVRGAETPTGDFTVLYKLEKTRMRGVNPSGTRYDIPNVPWVLAFWGDYTIHGAPWRQAFGIPQSNGCVSLPTSAAKTVYDWAPEGTLIHIHY